MDEFSVATIEHDQAHGLYVHQDGGLVVVSPGLPGQPEPAFPEGLVRRVGSINHPGVAREAIAAGVDIRTLVLAVAEGYRHGADLSEFQSTTPGGLDFYWLRVLNEFNREDSRWRQHKGDTDRMGVPSGPYGIIQPGAADPTAWANHFIALCHAADWQGAAVVDIELGDPNANTGFAQVVRATMRAAGFAFVMRYVSAGSTYRSTTNGIFDDDWFAAWGSRDPGGRAWQRQGSPLDLDEIKPENFTIVMGGAAPAPPVQQYGGSTEAMFPRNPHTGTIWLLAGGQLRGLNGDEWALLLWEFAVQNGGKGPVPVNMDNDLRIVQLARMFGVSDAMIQDQTGIDLGAGDHVLAAQLTATGPATITEDELVKQLAA